MAPYEIKKKKTQNINLKILKLCFEFLVEL